MRNLLLVVLVAAALHVQAEGVERSWVTIARCFAGPSQTGEWYDFNEAVPHLASFNFDNTIDSARITGVWIFYDEQTYNTYYPGMVYWFHGIDFNCDFPYEFANKCTSLRYAGSPLELNEPWWTVYSGEGFTEETTSGSSDAPSMGVLSNQVSSIIITGTSAWTFYDGPSYTGNSVCLQPNAHDQNLLQSLDVGLYPYASSFLLGDNTVESVRQGCWSDVVVRSNDLSTVKKNDRGAWGYIKP